MAWWKVNFGPSSFHFHHTLPAPAFHRPTLVSEPGDGCNPNSTSPPLPAWLQVCLQFPSQLGVPTFAKHCCSNFWRFIFHRTLQLVRFRPLRSFPFCTSGCGAHPLFMFPIILHPCLQPTNPLSCCASLLHRVLHFSLVTKPSRLASRLSLDTSCKNYKCGHTFLLL